MKRNEIKLALAAVAALGLTAHASDELQTVVTTATKTAQNIEGVAATVEVVTRKEIEQMGAESLKDILKRIPGITVQYGTFPSASAKSKSSVSIRGMSANGTLFLIDGRRLAGEVKNPYDLDRIPASIVERVEIVKGPMSSLYGADAVGGVINIITRRPAKKTRVDVGVRYGANDHGAADNVNLYGTLQGRHERLGYSFFANATFTEPYTQNEDADVYVLQPRGPNLPPVRVKPSQHTMPPVHRIHDSYDDVPVTYREESDVFNFGGHLEYDFTDAVTGSVDVGYLSEERKGVYVGYFHPTNYQPQPGKRLPAYNVPVNSDDDNERLDLSADLRYMATDTLDLKARVYWSSYEKRNTTTAKEYADMGYAAEKDSAASGMNADVDIVVGELTATWMPVDTHLVTGGLEYRDENRKATVFKQGSGMSEKSVYYQAAYLQDEWSVTDALDLILGARYDIISNADDKATFRIGALYTFSEALRVRANFAQGYRTPDIRELYIFKNTPNGLQVGADVMGYDLKPEETDAYEAALAGRWKAFDYEVVAFYNDVENMIQQVVRPYGTNPRAHTFENIGDAKTYGLETSVGYRFDDAFHLGLYWSELRTENEQTDKDLPFNPERTVMATLDYAPTSGLNLAISGRYVGEQYYMQIENRGAPTESQRWSKTDDYTVVDLSASWRWTKEIELFAGVDNVFDEKVDDVLGSSVGPFIYGGVRMKL